MRTVLNNRRECVRVKYTVYGPEKRKLKRPLFVDVSFKDDGSVAETFIVFDRDGPMNEILTALGITISVALQHGATGDDLADSLRGFPSDSIVEAVCKALKIRQSDPIYRENDHEKDT
jgi:hypothetical protein